MTWILLSRFVALELLRIKVYNLKILAGMCRKSFGKTSFFIKVVVFTCCSKLSQHNKSNEQQNMVPCKINKN